MKQKLLQNLFDFEREETTGEILFYRLFELFVVYWVIEYAWRWAVYIPRIGDVVMPTGLAEYIDVSFMFNDVLPYANAILMSLLAVVGFLRLSRWAYLGCLLAFHLQFVARFCLGKVAHGSQFVGLAVLALALASLAFEHRAHIRRFALGVCYFFFGLGYTTAAFSKLVGTGMHWSDGRHLWLWIGERTVDKFSLTGAIEYTWVQLLALDSLVIGTLMLSFGLLTELFGWLMWFKKPRPYIITLLLAMHIGIFYSLKITFSSNVYLLILLGYPWALFVDQALKRLDVTKRERLERFSLKYA